jgi:hypothetical protein
MGKLVYFVLVGLGFNMDALVQGLMVCVFVWAKYLFQTRWAVFFWILSLFIRSGSSLGLALLLSREENCIFFILRICLKNMP